MLPPRTAVDFLWHALAPGRSGAEVPPLFFINLGGLYFFLFIYFARPFISLKNPFLFISGAVFYFWARFLFFLPLFSWPKNKGR